MHGGEVPCLVDGDKNREFPGRDLEISRFRGFDADREEDRASARGRDPKITLPLRDICRHLIGDPDIPCHMLVAFSGVHVLLTS
jgi:hypothetical protein